MYSFGTRKLHYFLIVLFIASMSSCDAITGSDNEKEYFNAQYRFINTSDSLDAVNLLTGTYFPEDDYTTISTKNFQDVNYRDTLKITIDSLYIGCKVQIGSEVIKQWNDSSRYWKTFILDQDSVERKSDRIVTFIWPNDTTSVTKKRKKSSLVLYQEQ